MKKILQRRQERGLLIPEESLKYVGTVLNGQPKGGSGLSGWYVYYDIREKETIECILESLCLDYTNYKDCFFVGIDRAAVENFERVV